LGAEGGEGKRGDLSEQGEEMILCGERRERGRKKVGR